MKCFTNFNKVKSIQYTQEIYCLKFKRDEISKGEDNDSLKLIYGKTVTTNFNFVEKKN